jgi:hypothetical protein
MYQAICRASNSHGSGFPYPQDHSYLSVRPPEHRGSSLLKAKVRVRGARCEAGNSFAHARIFCGGTASRELSRLCFWTARTSRRPGCEGVSPYETVAQSPARSLCVYGPGRLGCSRQCRRRPSPQGASPPQEVSCPSPCSEEDPAACRVFLRLRVEMRGKLAARFELALRMLIESIESTPNGIPQE